MKREKFYWKNPKKRVAIDIQVELVNKWDYFFVLGIFNRILIIVLCQEAFR